MLQGSKFFCKPRVSTTRGKKLWLGVRGWQLLDKYHVQNGLDGIHVHPSKNAKDFFVQSLEIPSVFHGSASRRRQ
jgi:hypothetical protein